MALEDTFGEDFPNLFLLFNYLLTLPGSSVEAERGFSWWFFFLNNQVIN